MDLFKYLDPTTLDDSSFLTFSSFADLTCTSPYDKGFASFSDLEHGSEKKSPYHPTSSFTSTPPCSYSEYSGSESPEHPFSIISSAFSPSTPSFSGGDFGIFHTPSKAGPSKLSGPSPTVNSYPSQHVSHRSTSSSDWNSPVTPSLTYKSSVDSLATLAPEHEFFLPPSSQNSAYGWDDQSLGSSSSLAPLKQSPPSPSPYRIASNPSLGAYRHPRAIKQITSMPALKEEEQSVPFNIDDYVNDGSEPVAALAGEFNWAFPEFSNTDMSSFDNIGSTDMSAFDFSADQSNVASSSSNSDFLQQEAPALLPELSFSSVDETAIFNWANDQSELQSAPSTSYGSSLQPLNVDPSNVFAAQTRPATAPDGLGIWQDNSALGVPGPGSMLRSVSSDAVFPSRTNNSRDMFAYNVQDLGQVPQQTIYAHPPSQAFQAYQSGMPSQSFMARRNISHPLSINVPHQYYQQRQRHPDHLPLTPLSAPYMGALGYTSVKPTALPMKRVGSQPVNGAKAGRRSFSGESYENEAPPTRKVTKEEASVMQPVEPPVHTLRRESMPMVWAQPTYAPMYHAPHHPHMGSSALTNAPLVNVHPPQYQHLQQQQRQPLGYYSAPSQSLPPALPLGNPQKIHPPPHPGSSAVSISSTDAGIGPSSRPIARLPSAASKRPRQTSTPLKTPKTRTSPGRKKNVPSGGTFSWGDTTFINFTADDGEKLLTGVAPSGSQSKRKREEEQIQLQQQQLVNAGLLGVSTAMARPGSSGSISDGSVSDMGDDRSKRSRSGGE